MISRGGSGKEQLLPACSAPTPGDKRMCSVSQLRRQPGAVPAPRGRVGKAGSF